MAEAGTRARVGPAWWSLRVRTTLAAAAVTAVAVALAGWLLLRSIEDTQLAHVRDVTEAQVAQIERRLEAGVDPAAAVDAEVKASSGPVSLVEVIDEEGRTVAAGPTLEVAGQRGAIALVGDAGDVFTTRLPPPDGGVVVRSEGGQPPERQTQLLAPSLISTQPLERITREVDTPSGRYTIVAAAPVDEVQRSVDAVRRALWVALPALVALVAVAAWWLVGRALRPVEAIRAQVDEISGTTIHRRVPEPASGDEIGRLARTMNAMLARLEGASTRQRQFVSDASHELRSPVTAIRADLEVALAEGERADWPAVATAVLA